LRKREFQGEDLRNMNFIGMGNSIRRNVGEAEGETVLAKYSSA